MAKLNFKFKKLSENAQAPTKSHDGDLGYDLYASKDITIFPKSLDLVSTDIVIEFPEGWGAKIEDRSGLSLNGITTLAGIIDQSYRGPVGVVLYNISDHRYTVKKGDRIAQLVPHESHEVMWEEVEELTNTERSDGGFGSSGR